MSDLPIPHDREEVILNAIATGQAISCPEPHSRKEIYLKEIYENGGGSGGSGMTPEQVESIIEAKTDLSLSDISTNPVSNKAVTKAFEGYVAKVDGKDLSSNDYSDSEKQKVEDNSSNILMLRSESGHTINVTLDKSTYMMTVSLLNKAGEVLNEKTVDFPMETAFVNASYDKTSKTMKFTLESGSTVNVPLGDLVEGLVSQTDFDVLSGEVQTLKTEVNNNTNAISEIKANITTNIYNLNDVVKGKWITDKNGSTGSSTSWVYLPLNVKGLKTVTISALGGTASWNKHYFNDSNGTTIDYNNSQVTVSVPSDATILYVNIYEEFTDINSIKITTESVGEIITEVNDSLSALGKCKNLLKLKVGNMTQTGITLEVDNGKIHVYGTATENTFIHVAKINLKKGVTYKLCSQPFSNGNLYLANHTIYQNNVYTPSNDETDIVVLNIWNGQTVDFYITPMITTNLNATYDDFIPYTGDGDTLTEDVSAINSSMSDYGLNNVFDGVWNQDTDAGKVISNYYSVNSGDTIRIENCSGDAVVLLYNSSKEWQSNITNAVENAVAIPSNISYFRILLSSSVALTPTTADKIRLYINNQIDGLIMTKTFIKSIATSSSPAVSGQDYDISTSVYIDGYKAIGIINARIMNNYCSKFHIYGFNVDSSSTANIRTRCDVSGVSSEDLATEFTVLYVKQ